MPAQLSDGFHKRRTLDVTDRTAYLSDHEVESLVETLTQHPPLDLVRDVRHHLDRLTQIVAVSLTVDDGLVDAARSDRVVAGGVNTRKPLVMSQVEVGLHTVHRHVTLAVFIGVQRARVDVDVGIELLDGHLIATRLK